MKYLLLSATALATLQTAFAQETVADEGDTVVVTGIRKSLAESVDSKRRSNQILDVISAEDVGKLPDTNVSESLQRITGVQIERQFGEGAEIKVRGLSQNLVLFNGLNLLPVKRGDEAESRVQLEIFPSELFGALEVYKTPTAKQIEGAIGATVNLKTRTAFDFRGPTLNVTGQAVHTDLSESWGGRGSVTAANTFLDDRLGAIIIASVNQRNLREDKFETTGYESVGDVNGDGIADFKPDRLQFQIQDRERQKIGLYGGLEFRPSEGVRIYGDATFAQLEDDGPRSLARFVTGNDIVPGTDLIVSPNNTVLAGTFTAGGSSQYRGDGANQPLTNDFLILRAGAERNVGKFSSSVEVSLSESSRDEKLEQFFLAGAGTQLSYDLRGGEVPDIDFDLDVTNPDNFSSPLFQLFDQSTENEEFATRADFGYEWASGHKTEFGVRYRDTTQSVQDRRNADRSFFNRDFGLSSDGDGNTVLTLNGQDNLFDGVGGNFPRRFIISPLSASDINSLVDLSGVDLSAFGGDPSIIGPTDLVLIPSSSFDLQEEVTAFYVQHNFEYDEGAIPMRGNVGVRFVDTAITSEGFVTPTGYQRFNPNNFTDAADPTVPIPRTEKQEYFRALPSVNFQFDLRDDLILRLAAAETLSRPGISDLRVGVVSRTPPSIVGELGEASGGNPFLTPEEATQYDASLEYYFGNGSLLSVAYFNKQLSSFIIDATTVQTLPGFEPGFDQFLVTSPVNGQDGSIEGLEISYQQPLSMLPSPWDGFGVQANYTFVDSQQDAVNPITGEQLPLQDLSENSYNLIGYYEKYGFGIRAAYNWRDEFLAITSSRSGLPVFVSERGQLDISAFYDINENVSVTFEALNLGRDPVERFAGISERTEEFTIFARMPNV